MAPLTKQATKVINEYVERFDGNWKDVRREMLTDLGAVPVVCQNSVAFKQWRHELERVYQAMRPASQSATGTPRSGS